MYHIFYMLTLHLSIWDTLNVLFGKPIEIEVKMRTSDKNIELLETETTVKVTSIFEKNQVADSGGTYTGTIMAHSEHSKAYQVALTSPALTEQYVGDSRSSYPANYRGRVPLKVRMAKDVFPDAPIFEKGMVAEMNREYFVWVNKHGAVSAVFEDGKRLGLLPQEFDVIEWHKQL